MNRTRIAAIVAGLAAVLVSAAVASAAPAGGGIRLYVTGAGQLHQKVLIVGAIGDYGSSTSVDANGKPNPNGNFEQLKLQDGSLLVDATKFNAVGNHARPTLASAKTCSVVVSWSGSASIVRGTGHYSGVSGDLKLQGTFAGVSARFKSGPHKGQCQMGNNAAPRAFFISVTGAGNVKLG